MDINIGGGLHDILSDVGFCNTLFQCLNLLPGSRRWLAPVCSSWVFMILGLFQACLYSKLRHILEVGFGLQSMLGSSPASGMLHSLNHCI